MKSLVRIFVFFFASALINAPLFAAWNYPASPWTKENTYTDKMIHKLGFGAMNVLTGWSDILFEPARSGLVKGIPLGVVHFATDVVGGVLHVATFPVPVDIPLPDGGVNFETQRAQ